MQCPGPALCLGFTMLLTVPGLAPLAQTVSPIGTVATLQGEVSARNAAGETRKLGRNAAIYQRDTILTGPAAQLQLRMIDTAKLAIAADTEFTFSEYAFDGNPATPDTAVMKLGRGGFRAISGKISDTGQSVLQFDTPVASICAAGAVHEAVLDGDSLYTGVTSGAACVRNKSGLIEMGVGGDYNYSVTQPGQAPVGLLSKPYALLQMDK